MVARKREDPFTPNPGRGIQQKKMKEYVSPAQPKTPLRNVMTPDQSGSGAVVQSTSKRPAAGMPQGGSLSRSRLVTSMESLNDDEMERRAKREELTKKRRDRKTDLLSPVVGSSPKASLPQSFSGSRKGARTAGGNSGNTPLGTVLSSEMAARPLPGSGAKPKMTAEQMNKVFEEWIKIAADNKINSKNTWSLALIDYFSDLTLLKDGNSINFQKASCTLDGCVKIYSSRVDSVVDETGKLINGLAEGNMKNSRYLKGDLGAGLAGEDTAPHGDGDEEEDGEEEGSDGDGGKKKAALHKKASRHVDTLEKSADALNLKQFDLEYAVDPLFKKTSAEFDESSSRGMLLHSLPLSATGQVIFDSTDSSRLQAVAREEPQAATVDSSLLKATFATQIASLSGRRLSPTFAEFSLSQSNAGKYDKLVQEQVAKALDRLGKLNIQPVVEAAMQPMEVDGQVFDDTPLDPYEADGSPMDDDYGIPMLDDDYGFPAADEVPMPDSGSEEAQGLEETQQDGFAPDSAPANIFSYLDDAMKQSWAGPNHWKVRRPALAKSAAAAGDRPKRKQFVLEFHQETEVDIEALFAKPSNPATITLSKTLIEERAQKDNLLPEDMHFSSANFLRLFTKPTWKFGTATSRSAATRLAPRERPLLDEDAAQKAPVEPEFWVQNDAHPEGVADLDLDMNPEPMQGIDDDYGGPYPGDSGDDEPSQSLAASQAATNLGLDLVALKAGVQLQRLSFSRVAKRVDVHKLKEAIWEEMDVAKAKRRPADGGTKFSDMVRALDESSYPKEGLKDVSVSYCFICLLHLANEHELKLTKQGTDLVVEHN